MTKCDGCVERVKRGMQPACVKVCPFGALSLVSESEYQELMRTDARKKISYKILD